MADVIPPLPDLNQGERIKDTFIVVKKLGQGGFGAVYAVCKIDTKEKYAMKIENIKEKVKVLKIEVVLMKALEANNAKHVPRIVDHGRNNPYNFVIMTLLGPTLNDIRKSRNTQRLTLSTVLRVGKQCIVSVLDIHNIGFLHRDIKPANYCIGKKSNNTQQMIYMLDFGLARKYIEDNKTLKPPRSRAGFRGTLRYAPLACHRSKEMCRREDLETWMYMQIELTSGKLPWREVVDRDEIGKQKESTRKDKSLFKHCPAIYHQILEKIDATDYYQQPDYKTFHTLLDEEMIKGKFSDDEPYDWEIDFKELKGKIKEERKKPPSIQVDHRQKYKPSTKTFSKAKSTAETQIQVIQWKPPAGAPSHSNH